LPVGVIDLGLTMLVALAVVTGLQLVGVVLMSAMLVAPAAAARQWTDRLGRMVVLAALFGAASGAVGALLSATGRGLATGPLIVLVASGIVLFSLFAAPNRGLVWAALRSRRERNLLRERHVLADLYALAASHGDPHYKTERGMVDTLYGASAGASLKALAAQGLVARAGHMQEEGEHWVLTERGYARAQALQDPEARRE
jgi:manganese/zinc/iron transport system permease protein